MIEIDAEKLPGVGMVRRQQEIFVVDRKLMPEYIQMLFITRMINDQTGELIGYAATMILQHKLFGQQAITPPITIGNESFEKCQNENEAAYVALETARKSWDGIKDDLERQMALGGGS